MPNDLNIYMPFDESYTDANKFASELCPCGVSSEGGDCPYTDDGFSCFIKMPYITCTYNVTASR